MEIPYTAVILSERGPERFLQFGGGESKDLQLFFNQERFVSQIRTHATKFLGSQS